MFKMEKISASMSKCGFDAWGVVRIEGGLLSDAKDHFEQWLAEGNGRGLDYLERNVEKRFAPEVLFEGAKTVIVGAVSYKNDLSMGYGADFGAKIASYARATDYHTVIKDMLHQVASELGLTNPRDYKVCVDSVPLAEKSLARLAGIGWQGRNSLIISPSLGSFIHLGELIVRHEVDTYSTPLGKDGCVGCKRCLLRCPTGAINPNRTINATLCISNRTIEQGEENFDFRGWIFGCDECQSCCPHNAVAPLAVNPRLQPTFDPRDYDRHFWDTLTPEEGQKRFGHTAIARKFRKIAK